MFPPEELSETIGTEREIGFQGKRNTDKTRDGMILQRNYTVLRISFKTTRKSNFNRTL